MLCKYGFLRLIIGFMLQIETVNHYPVCCNLPWYGPDKSSVMIKLVAKLDNNGIVEECGGSWGTLVVLYANPHQENPPWHEFQWRLCVSYSIWTRWIVHLPSQYRNSMMWWIILIWRPNFSSPLTCISFIGTLYLRSKIGILWPFQPLMSSDVGSLFLWEP